MLLFDLFFIKLAVIKQYFTPKNKILHLESFDKEENIELN